MQARPLASIQPEQRAGYRVTDELRQDGILVGRTGHAARFKIGRRWCSRMNTRDSSSGWTGFWLIFSHVVSSDTMAVE